MPGRFYVTTPIYYVNDAPHVGHAYATVNADAPFGIGTRHGWRRVGEPIVLGVIDEDLRLRDAIASTTAGPNAPLRSR